MRPTPAVDAAFAARGPRHDRQDPLHLRLHRPAQGRDQHPAHAVRKPGERGGGLDRSSTDHPPVIVDWLPWNHTFGANHNFNMMLRNGGTLYIDEGKPVPALIGRTDRQPARGIADGLFQRAARLRGAARSSGARRGAAAEVLRPARPDALRGGGAAADLVGPPGATGRQGARQQGAVHLLLGPDRDRAGRHHGALPDGPAGQHRRAGAGHAGETGARRGQARDPGEGSQRHARLLQGAGAHRQGLRRGRLAQDRRCRALRRPRRSRRRPAVRRPRGGELQAARRAPGSTSARCALR